MEMICDCGKHISKLEYKGDVIIATCGFCSEEYTIKRNQDKGSVNKLDKTPFCNKCKTKIGELESYLVYAGKKYCKKCIVWMVFKKEALPNDGSLLGGSLAKELSDEN